MLLLSMFVRPKMGCVRGKIGLTGQFDLRQPGNYLQPCNVMIVLMIIIIIIIITVVSGRFY